MSTCFYRSYKIILSFLCSSMVRKHIQPINQSINQKAPYLQISSTRVRLATHVNVGGICDVIGWVRDGGISSHFLRQVYHVSGVWLPKNRNGFPDLWKSKCHIRLRKQEIIIKVIVASSARSTTSPVYESRGTGARFRTCHGRNREKGQGRFFFCTIFWQFTFNKENDNNNLRMYSFYFLLFSAKRP